MEIIYRSACHGGHELTIGKDEMISSISSSIDMQTQGAGSCRCASTALPFNSINYSSSRMQQHKASRGDLGADDVDDSVDVVDDDDDELEEEEDMAAQEQQEIKHECSMCGHVGLAQYLFKCLCCSSRFQHTYCSKLYPYRMETSICNWCLPLKLEFVSVAGEEFNDPNHTYNSLNSIDNTNIYRGTKLNSRSDSFQQVKKKIEKHSKAFEYLLQIIAELADGRCHWPTEAGKDNNKFTKCVDSSEIESDVCLNGSGYSSRKHINSQNAHHANLMQQSNMFKEVDHESKLCFYTRRAEAQSVKGHVSATTPLKRPCSVRDSCQLKRVTVEGDDDHFLIIRSPEQNKNCELADSRKISGDKKVGYVQDQNLSLSPQSKLMIDDGQGGSFDTGVQGIMAAASVAKRPRSIKKQCVADAGDDCTNDYTANEGSETLTRQKLEAGNLGLMSLSYVNKMAVAAVEDIVADERPHELHASKQISSPVAVYRALTQKPGTGHARRDHQLTLSSPSRAMNRRYKRLADVLC